MERFTVKDYRGNDRPEIKGNGFDGLEIGSTREDAQELVDWINKQLDISESRSDFIDRAFNVYPNLDLDISDA